MRTTVLLVAALGLVGSAAADRLASLTLNGDTGCTALSNSGANWAAAQDKWACYKGAVAKDGGTSSLTATVSDVPDGYNLVFYIVNYLREDTWSIDQMAIETPKYDRSNPKEKDAQGNALFELNVDGTKVVGLSAMQDALTKDSDKAASPFGYQTTIAGNNLCKGEYILRIKRTAATTVSFSILVGLVKDMDIPKGTSWTAPGLSTGGSSLVQSTVLMGLGGDVYVPVNEPWAQQGYPIASLDVTVKPGTEMASLADHTADNGGVAWDVDLVAVTGVNSDGKITGTKGVTRQTGIRTIAENTGVVTYDGKNSYADGGVSRHFAFPSPRSSINTNAAFKGLYLRITPPPLNDARITGGVDWTKTMFWDFTVTMTSTEFPSFTGSNTVQFDTRSVRPGTGDTGINGFAIFKYTPDSNLWSTIDATFSSVQDMNVNNNMLPAAAAVVNSDGTVAGVVGALDGQVKINYGGAGTTVSSQNANTAYTENTLYNKDMWASAPSALSSGGSSKTLDPYPYESVPPIFVLIKPSSCDGTFTTMSVTGSGASSAEGECKDYRDCFAPADDHPSGDRVGLSANSDANRWTRCRVGTDTSTPGAFVPKTQCYECASSCDCNAGQYCSGDRGNCQDSQGIWQCDAESGKKFGTCQNKNEDIIGSRCRPGIGARTFGASVPSADTIAAQSWTSNTQVMYTTPDDDTEPTSPTGPDWNAADNTGYGFCGELRFYNASNGVTGGAWTARTTLWTGTCLNFVCTECTPSFNGNTNPGANSAPNQGASCSGTKICQNGRIVDRIDMDFTTRTYTKNALAGTMLGATFMVIILQMCVAANIFMAKK